MGGKEAIRVLITGAAGQIGYSLIPLICSGDALGRDQPINLVLLDIPPAAKVLTGVAMEIDDAAYDLVNECIATTDMQKAFEGVQVAVLVGGFPRGPGMERKDLMAKNKPIFVAAGEALNKWADPNCHVLVVANPANTNALIAATHAPKIPKANFTALTRLDMNRGAAQLAKKLHCNAHQIRNVTIWGNHSKTQVPDATAAVFTNAAGQSTSVPSSINDDKYLHGEFMTIVQNRGAEVIAARGLSSALSAANAIKDHLYSWLVGTAPGETVSMGVYTEASAPYGISPGLIYSYPVTCKAGNYKIVQDLQLPDVVRSNMKISEKELLEEKAEAGL